MGEVTPDKFSHMLLWLANMAQFQPVWNICFYGFLFYKSCDEYNHIEYDRHETATKKLCIMNNKQTIKQTNIQISTIFFSTMLSLLNFNKLYINDSCKY